MNEDLNLQLVLSKAVLEIGYQSPDNKKLLLSRGSMVLACLQALTKHYKDERIIETDFDWIDDQINRFADSTNANIWMSDDNYDPDDETFMFDPSELPSF